MYPRPNHCLDSWKMSRGRRPSALAKTIVEVQGAPTSCEVLSTAPKLSSSSGKAAFRTLPNLLAYRQSSFKVQNKFCRLHIRPLPVLGSRVGNSSSQRRVILSELRFNLVLPLHLDQKSFLASLLI